MYFCLDFRQIILQDCNNIYYNLDFNLLFSWINLILYIFILYYLDFSLILFQIQHFQGPFETPKDSKEDIIFITILL